MLVRLDFDCLPYMFHSISGSAVPLRDCVLTLAPCHDCCALGFNCSACSADHDSCWEQLVHGSAARASCLYASTHFKLVCATVRHCTGVVVCCRAVNEGSPLSGQLEAGDNIWMLNQCPVTSSRSWLDCLATSNFHDSADHSRSPR
jgi:hypothetical protein